MTAVPTRERRKFKAWKGRPHEEGSRDYSEESID
jgi:hypothetical protein